MAQLLSRWVAFMPPATVVQWLDADPDARNEVGTWLLLDFFKGLKHRGELARRPIGGLPPCSSKHEPDEDYMPDHQFTVLARYMLMRDVRPPYFTPDVVAEYLSDVFTTRGWKASVWSSRYGAMSEWIPRLVKTSKRVTLMGSLTSLDVVIAVPLLEYVEDRAATLEFAEAQVKPFQIRLQYGDIDPLQRVPNWIAWIDDSATDRVCESFGEASCIVGATVLFEKVKFSSNTLPGCLFLTTSALRNTLPKGFQLVASWASIDLSGLFGVPALPRAFLSGGHVSSLDVSPLCMVHTIDEYVFSSMKNITAMDLRGMDSVTTVGAHFLSDCAALRSIDLRPLTKLTCLGSECLTRCASLTTVVGLPPELRSIPFNAFSNCVSLTSIVIAEPCAAVSIDVGFAVECPALCAVDLSGLTALALSIHAPFMEHAKDAAFSHPSIAMVCERTDADDETKRSLFPVLYGMKSHATCILESKLPPPVEGKSRRRRGRRPGPQ